MFAAEAARVCGYDRDLVLGFITHAEVQTIEWRSSAEETEDPEEAKACGIEAAAWGDTAALLRGALRKIVLSLS